MPNWIDLHCHYLPGIDDGVRTLEDGVTLCQGLAEIGFKAVVATPHIRYTLWPENRRSTLTPHFERFVNETKHLNLPQLALSAEHFYDEFFIEFSADQEILPYPGGKTILVEFAYGSLPVGIDKRLFSMRVGGMTPVIAHPERYTFEPHAEQMLIKLFEAKYPFLLDLMSLVGKYGKGPQHQAERYLQNNYYYAACSDAHQPADLQLVALAIEQLKALVGEAKTEKLLADNPQKLVNFELS